MANTRMARVKVIRAIAYDGIVIRPEIDDSPRIHGKPVQITPVEAVIPEDLAVSFGKRYVEIIGRGEMIPAAKDDDKQPEGGEKSKGKK